MAHIFISYSHHDKAYVHKLQAALQNEGFDAWIDDRIDYGQQWPKAIQEHLDQCDAFIIVMSRNSFESEMVQNEVTRAHDQGMNIFPVLLDGENWLIVQAKQYTDVRDGSLPTGKFYDQLRTYAPSNLNFELNIDPSKEITKPDIRKIIKEVKAIIEDINDYSRAKETAETYIPAVEKYGNDPELIPILQLLRVWYAHALMYVGDTGHALDILKEAINKLQENSPAESDEDYLTWCEALGRAHNHIGYINWVDFGCLEKAGKEFLEAISFFLNTTLRSELATAYDNFGRVYSQLGYSTYAEIIIDNGRQLRAKDEARLPLSLDSMAVAYLDAGQPNRALNFSKEALFLFQDYYKKTSKGSRRIGLALLTQGRALRRLGSLDYTSEINEAKSFKENLDLLEKAKDVLIAAKDKFESTHEKLRLFQVCNELACVMREQAKFFKKMGNDNESHQLTENVEELIKDSLRYLSGTIQNGDLKGDRNQKAETYIRNMFTRLDALKSAEERKYRLYLFDSCEDLARAWFLAGGRLSRVENVINTTLENIPKEYDIRHPDFYKTSIEIQNEEYWQQIGKLYALWGEICFKNGQHADATEKYILATSYFDLFRQRSEKTNIFPTFRPELASHRALTIKIHNDLKTLSQKDLKVLREEILVSFETKNPQISADWYQDFKDILELACLVNDS